MTETQMLVPLGETEITKAFASPGTMDEIIARIEKTAKSEVADVSTKKGRDAIKSLAYKIARSKTALDKAGKDLNAEARKQIEAVDAERRKIRTKLDALAEDVRKPLTEWEKAEAARIDAHQQAIAALAKQEVNEHSSSEQIRAAIDDIKATEIGENFEEFYALATQARDKAIARLETALEIAEDRESLARERDELARKQREIEEQQRQAEEAQRQVAEREAQERAEAEARRKADEEARLAAEKRAEEAERARIEAEERAAREAEEREKAHQEALEQARREAAERAAEAFKAPEPEPAPKPEPEPEPESSSGYTRAQKLFEIEREIVMRKRAYPRWVKDGRMSQEDADERLAIMKAIASDYRAADLFSEAAE